MGKMKTNVGILVAATAFVVLLVAGVGWYVYSTIPVDHTAAAVDNRSASPGDGSAASVLPAIAGDAKTGLGAYQSVAESQPLQDWKAARQNVTLVSISSDTCLAGVSSTWKLTMAADGERTTFYVANGEIVNSVVSETDSAATGEAPDTAKAIDSDAAWEKAAKRAFSERIGEAPVTMTLKSIDGKEYWDIYDLDSAVPQIVRVDAVSGDVVNVVSAGG